MTVLVTTPLFKVPLPEPPHLVVCPSCPWAGENQLKKPDPFSFYTKKNLLRLWRQLRTGENRQSCHLTDPTNDDHIKAGCALNAKIHECAGSVVLLQRELVIVGGPERIISPEGADAYLATRRMGLTRAGLLANVMRLTHPGVPLIGGVPFPVVDVANPRVVLPDFLGVKTCESITHH